MDKLFPADTGNKSKGNSDQNKFFSSIRFYQLRELDNFVPLRNETRCDFRIYWFRSYASEVEDVFLSG